MKKKDFIPTKLLWVDLEMTGLDPTKDVILEVAAIITDFDFQNLASFEAIVQQDAKTVRTRIQANPWWQEFPENRDEFLAKIKEGLALTEVEDELLALVKAHFNSEPVALAGNSVHMDRSFIKAYLPRLEQKLHYRMLDVTAWKLVMEAKYHFKFEKTETHRALDDIQESIAELQYYLKRRRQG